MLDAVLHEWLQDQVRDERSFDVRRDVEDDVQPSGKAHLKDVEIDALERRFFRNRDQPLRVERKGDPKKVGQMLGRVLRLLGTPLADQRCNRIERIEQEVRLELAPECTQLRILRKTPQCGDLLLPL